MGFIKFRVFGRDKLDSIYVEDTASILWDTIQSHEVMEEFSKYHSKHHPYITSIFFRLLITAKIYENLREIGQKSNTPRVLE